MRYKNKTINFKFTKDEENNKPILFILHGHGHSGGPSNFQSPNWIVVFPMDQFGVDKQGSWFSFFYSSGEIY